MKTKGTVNIRYPAVAGTFYPGSRNELQALLNRLFEGSIHMGVSPKSLIVPHAGYLFSGSVAASGYGLLDAQSVNLLIFLIGVSHRSSFCGAVLDSHEAYRTPLGDVMINMDALNYLDQHGSLFFLSSQAHLNEHSLEVQLPFLQSIYNNGFTIVPILLGSTTTDELQQMARVLQPFFERHDTLFVVSTDLSHYPPMEIACETDQRVIEAICTGDPDALKRTLQKESSRNLPGYQTGLCGYKAVLLLQYITSRLKTARYQLVKYQNSGHTQHGSTEEVVGYASISVTI